MYRESLLALAYEDEPSSNEAVSRSTYNYLVDSINNSEHGVRFNVRPFSIEPIDNDRASGMDTSYPYSVTNDVDPDQQMWIAETVSDLLLPKQDAEALLTGISEVFYSDVVQEHLALGNSVAFVSNHLSYADIIAESSALTQARLIRNEVAPNTTQDIIAHRMTGLFMHELIEVLYNQKGYSGKSGHILEDVILQFSGDLQTMPASNSGRTNFIENVIDGKKIRKNLNDHTVLMWNRLLNLGGRTFFIAGGGSQSVLNTETGIMEEKPVGYGTAELLIGANKQEGAERLLVIPLYIHADPFSKATDDLPTNPQPTPFAFLEPRFLKTHKDAHNMMREIITTGNRLKPSGAPELIYKTKRITTPLKSMPLTIFEHTT